MLLFRSKLVQLRLRFGEDLSSNIENIHNILFLCIVHINIYKNVFVHLSVHDEPKRKKFK